MTKSKTIREILIDYGEKCFYDGLEIDPNEDYASDGYEADVDEAKADILALIQQSEIKTLEQVRDIDYNNDITWDEINGEQYSKGYINLNEWANDRISELKGETK